MLLAACAIGLLVADTSISGRAEAGDSNREEDIGASDFTATLLSKRSECFERLPAAEAELAAQFAQQACTAELRAR